MFMHFISLSPAQAETFRVAIQAGSVRLDGLYIDGSRQPPNLVVVAAKPRLEEIAQAINVPRSVIQPASGFLSRKALAALQVAEVIRGT